ncbi:MAG: ABC transporter permease [Anaerolineaceae bacterium]|nr:ABC transporter permease [Anaerolineaceae bacterium]
MPDESGVKKFLDRSFDALLPLLAAPFAFLIGGIILLALNVDPLKAYGVMITGALGDVSGITQTLVRATPLLLVALGIVIAFRGGVLNIGGEGQLVMGAIATTALVLWLESWPGWILMILSMLAGAAAGAVWGGIPGLLRARLGVSENLSTIMMNAIAAQFANFLLVGPLMDPLQREMGTFLPESSRIPKSVWLYRPIPQASLHIGFFIALILALLVYIFLWRTSIGYRIRAVGLNPAASRYAGINVPHYEALALTLGGMFAGLAGSFEILGVHHKLLQYLSSGYGFSGIVVALFGNLHPLGAIPASILFGGLLVGGDKMQRAVQVPSALITTISGLVVLFVVSSVILTERRARRRKIHG